MIFGIVLLVLTGICWVGIAVVVSDAARKRLDIDTIQFAASAAIALAALCVIPFQTPLAGTTAQKFAICGFVFVAGAGNYLMLKLMRRAMVLGNSGAVWGITQSALLCPFLMGMFFFGVAPTLYRILGIALILLGIFLFSRTTPKHGRRSRRWLLPTLGAFAASGLAQCFANLPSYWTETAMGSVLRACLVQAGTIGLFALTVPFESKKPRFGGIWKPVVLLSGVQILSLFFFFYRGLNLVADAGCGSVGYPIAQGSCIAGFLLYNRLVSKEITSWHAFPAFLSVCAGIVVIAL